MSKFETLIGSQSLSFHFLNLRVCMGVSDVGKCGNEGIYKFQMAQRTRGCPCVSCTLFFIRTLFYKNMRLKNIKI